MSTLALCLLAISPVLFILLVICMVKISRCNQTIKDLTFDLSNSRTRVSDLEDTVKYYEDKLTHAYRELDQTERFHQWRFLNGHNIELWPIKLRLEWQDAIDNAKKTPSIADRIALMERAEKIIDPLREVWRQKRADDARKAKVSHEHAHHYRELVDDFTLFVAGLAMQLWELRDQTKIKRMRDEVMLTLLLYLNRRITVDRNCDIHPWPITGDESVEMVLDARPAVRGILMDLVRHRNREFMDIIDSLPSDVAQYLMRLALADPKETAPPT